MLSAPGVTGNPAVGQAGGFCYSGGFMSKPATRLQVPQVDLKAQYAALKDEIQAALARVLESQRFILGEEGEGLERELAEVCGVPYAVGCASGSDALLLSLVMDANNYFSARFELPVIEDAAQALGAGLRGRRVGSLARTAWFSFYPA